MMGGFSLPLWDDDDDDFLFDISDEVKNGVVIFIVSQLNHELILKFNYMLLLECLFLVRVVSNSF